MIALAQDSGVGPARLSPAVLMHLQAAQRHLLAAHALIPDYRDDHLGMSLGALVAAACSRAAGNVRQIRTWAREGLPGSITIRPGVPLPPACRLIADRPPRQTQQLPLFPPPDRPRRPYDPEEGNRLLDEARYQSRSPHAR